MPRPQPSLRRTFGECDWGPTVDGRILPHHPFDPGAPPISADVPLLTGTNLHESVSGVDHPDANEMAVEELNRLVTEELGDRQPRRSSPPTGAITLKRIHSTSMRLLRPARFACRHSSKPPGRPLWVARPPTLIYIRGGRPFLDNRPGSFHACEISFTFDNAEICDHYSAGTPEAFAFYRSRSVPPG